MTYLILFLMSAVLAIVLRYWGEEILSQVTAMASTTVPGFCSSDRCWGMQGAYRISFGSAIFFAIMVLFTAAVPITHLGGWLVKVFLYALLLGLSFLPTNDTMAQYADVARGFSVIFLLAQVLIIINFAYDAHDWLKDKMDATDRRFELDNFEPGLLSNGWRNLYAFASFSLFIGSLVALGFLYNIFGGSCPLHNFFISETLVLGVVFTLISMMNVIGKGLLPPSILFAYNTYLCYGALTNNPDTDCNRFAASGSQSEASIYTGLVIAAFSVTWAAYSSAGSFTKAVRMDGTQTSVDNPAAGAGSPSVTDWPPASGRDKAPVAGSAGAYQSSAAAAAAAADDDDEETGARRPAVPQGDKGTTSASSDQGVEEKPWVFHIIMCLAGMYLAMLVTNWGSPSSANSPTGNPELSNASMWARMGSQWAIHGLFLWTMIAPTCCPGRSFGRE